MNEKPPDNSHYKMISIDQVTIGMHVEDVFDAQGVLLISQSVPIKSRKQIDYLQKRGVKIVLINTDKGKNTDNDVKDDTGNGLAMDLSSLEKKRKRLYKQELENAFATHRQAIRRAVSIFKSISNDTNRWTKEVNRTAEDIVTSLLRNPEALVCLTQIKGFDSYTYTHSVNVGVLMTSLALSMNYSGEELVDICIGGLLHDIGKMHVPEPILTKPGSLTAKEFAIIKKHPEEGLKMVKDKKEISPLAKTVILQHHERYNGCGYPRGLKEWHISDIGLMSAVVDVYDALTSDRVYKSAWPPQLALAEIFKGCDKEYSRHIVERFTKNIGIYPVGSFVKMKTGEMGIVIHVDKEDLLAPVLLILFDKDEHRLKRPYHLNLQEKRTGHDDALNKIHISLDPKAFGVTVRDYLTEIE